MIPCQSVSSGCAENTSTTVCLCMKVMCLSVFTACYTAPKWTKKSITFSVQKKKKKNVGNWVKVKSTL